MRTHPPHWIRVCLLAVMLMTAVSQASAFCGFYVGKAGGDLFNSASRVVIARTGERTVVTMANDYQGEFADFGIVIVQLVLQAEFCARIGKVLDAAVDMAFECWVEFVVES